MDPGVALRSRDLVRFSLVAAALAVLVALPDFESVEVRLDAVVREEKGVDRKPQRASGSQDLVALRAGGPVTNRVVGNPPSLPHPLDRSQSHTRADFWSRPGVVERRASTRYEVDERYLAGDQLQIAAFDSTG